MHTFGSQASPRADGIERFVKSRPVRAMITCRSDEAAQWSVHRHVSAELERSWLCHSGQIELRTSHANENHAFVGDTGFSRPRRLQIPSDLHCTSGIRSSKIKGDPVLIQYKPCTAHHQVRVCLPDSHSCCIRSRYAPRSSMLASGIHFENRDGLPFLLLLLGPVGSARQLCFLFT